jgi:aspartate carbamoyltransferase catalytic subunit
LSKEEILLILQHAKQLAQEGPNERLKGKLIGTCFFEPSTRTRLSFESAALRNGGQVLGFSDSLSTSSQKGESLFDTMKMMEAYVDAIVLRHPLEGSAQHAADSVNIPVINAGDGANQHPTQTLLDLYSIHECHGGLEDLKIAMVGDLKHGRTVHSLAEAATLFGARLFLVTPPGLEMPNSTCRLLKRSGTKFSLHRTVEEVLARADILYMTRVQKERFDDPQEYARQKDCYRITPELLEQAKPGLKILHPLPRQAELDPRVDQTENAYYFQQAKNGLYVRQALLDLILTA